jgi:hypothetical protein
VRGEARDYLVFRALHAVMDGQGTLLWAHDVLRCLRGQAPVGHPDVLDVRTLYDPARDQRRRRPPHDALRPLGPPAPGPGRAPGWRRVRVPVPLSPTVSGRIVVGLAELARANNDEPGPVRIHLPVDLRCYAKAARTTGNLFGSLYLEVEPQTTPDQVGLQIVRLLYEQEGRRPLGLYAAGAEFGSLAAHRVRAWRELSDHRAARRYATSATVSHLGRLDSGLLSGPGWTTTSALFVPPVVDGCSVSVNGVDEHTELTVGLAGWSSPGELESLAEALGRALAG